MFKPLLSRENYKVNKKLVNKTCISIRRTYTVMEIIFNIQCKLVYNDT